MCQGRFYRSGDPIRAAWHPIGPGDPDEIWIETEEDREQERQAEEEVIETEEETENESDKENA